MTNDEYYKVPLKDYENLTRDVRRLRWLVEWVTEHASFTGSEWELWEKLESSREPWNEDQGRIYE